ncbi:MAG: ribosome biogenesis factor YjgA [Gammaproteobacteria bacterium]|jgi:ribosome-associated protein
MNAHSGLKPSKTRRKRESEALQSLGEALIGLPAAALAEAPIPEKLREAVELARRLTKHGALRRQRQYIGKLMREIEPEALEGFLARRADLAQRERRRFHALERWRDRILKEGDAAIDACVDALGADAAELRKLAAAAGGPLDEARRKRAGRALFRYLDSIVPADGDRAGEL